MIIYNFHLPTMVSTLTKGKRHRLSSQDFWTGLITPQVNSCGNSPCFMYVLWSEANAGVILPSTSTIVVGGLIFSQSKTDSVVSTSTTVSFLTKSDSYQVRTSVQDPRLGQTSVDKSVVKQNTIIQVALADTSKLMHSNLKNLPCLRKNTLAV